MKKKILMLLIILINSCSCENITNIEYSNLKLYKEIELEENEDVILNNITSVAFNSDCSKFIVSSYLNYDKVIIYDTNGKIIKFFEPSVYFCDSIAIKRQYWKGSVVILKSSDLVNSEGKSPTIDEISKDLIHSYGKGIFLNDSIILIIGHIKTYANDLRNGVKKCIDSLAGCSNTSLIIININNGEQTVNPFEKNTIVATPYSALYNSTDSILYCSCMSEQYSSICAYHLNGEFIKVVSNLPDEYISSGIKYSITCDPEIIYDTNKNMIATYPYVDKIYNITNGSFFNLQNLPSYNTVFLEKLAEEQKKYKSDYYFQNLLNKIQSLYLTFDGNYFVSILCEDTIDYRNNSCHILQVYKPDGELLKQAKLPLFENDFINKFVAYSKKDDLILSFHISKTTGWKIKFWKW
jgi:hypothetical protein